MAQIELTAAYLQKPLQSSPVQGLWLVTDAAGNASLVSLSQIDKSHVGLANVANTKNQYTATRIPLSTDDVTQGYTIGSVWVFGVNAWMCVGASGNAAVWTALTGGGGGGGLPSTGGADGEAAPVTVGGDIIDSGLAGSVEVPGLDGGFAGG